MSNVALNERAQFARAGNPDAVDRFLASLPDPVQSILIDLAAADLEVEGKALVQRREVEEIQARIDRVNDSITNVDRIAETHSLSDATKAEKERLLERKRELTEERNKAQAKPVYGNSGMPRVREWAGQNMNKNFRAAPVNLDIATGTALVSLNANIDLQKQHRADINKLKKARRTTEEALADAIQQVRSLAQAGTPDVAGLHMVREDSRGDLKIGRIVWPRTVVRDLENEPLAMRVVDPLALFCWLHGPAIEKRLTTLIQENEPEFSVSLKDRVGRIAKLEAQSRRLRYEQSALTLAARREGANVRYTISDVEALLQIERVARPVAVDDGFDFENDA